MVPQYLMVFVPEIKNKTTKELITLSAFESSPLTSVGNLKTDSVTLLGVLN